MSFKLHQRKHIERELAKIFRRELRKAARVLTASGGTFEEAVHESRQHLKKAKAVASCLEDAGAKLPRKDRKWLKSAARPLSKLRDSAAIVDTFDRLRRRYPKQLSERIYGSLRRGLVGARNREQARARRRGTVREAGQHLASVRKSARDWAAPSIGMSGMVAVVALSYRRSRDAMTRARATGQSATLHRWRKELKTLWYQLRLAQPLTTGVAPLIAGLKQLQTELGDDHNLVVLAATLRGCPDLRPMRQDILQIDRLAGRMRQRLRRRAFALGRRLYVRKPKAFARWIRGSTK
jgi:CHAD domain-containing protein